MTPPPPTPPLPPQVRAHVLEVIASDPGLQQAELVLLGLFGRSLRLLEQGERAPGEPGCGRPGGKASGQGLRARGSGSEGRAGSRLVCACVAGEQGAWPVLRAEGARPLG